MTRRLWALWALVLAVLAAALWAARHYYQLGGFNDDACYVVRAEGILQGRLLPWLDQDRMASAYFAGYPMLLAPVLALVGPQPWALQLYSLLFTLLGATATMLLARRRLSVAPAFALGATYALTPAGLSCGTIAMSDVPFAALFVTALAWGARELETGAERWAWLGLLVSLVMIVRLPGAVLAVAFGLPLALERRWRSLLLLALGCSAGGLYTLAMMRLTSGSGSYADQVARFYGQSSFLQQQATFWARLPGELARDFLATGWAWPVTVACLVGMLAALARRRPDPVALAVAAYLAFSSLWFVQEPRYFLMVWPLLALLAVVRLPTRWALACLALALLATLPESAGRLRQGETAARVWDERRHEYAALRQSTRPEDVLCGVMTCTLELYTGRAVYSPARSPVWSVFLAGAVTQGCSVLVLEPEDSLVSIQGRVITTTPAHQREWADRSSLLDKLYEGRFLQAYRLRPEARALPVALEHYVRGAFRESDPERQRAAFRQALAACPDFPDAVKALARLESDPVPLLEREVRQYPCDLEAAYMLATALRDRGQGERSRAVAAAALEEARRLREPTAPLEALLR